MKKFVLYLILCVFLFVHGCSKDYNMNSNTSTPKIPTQTILNDNNQDNTDNTDNKIVVYSMTQFQFGAFLNSPQGDCLETTAVKCYYSIESDDKIRSESKQSIDSQIRVEYQKEGVYRIASTPVYRSLIQFWGSKANVDRYLKDNNVVDTALQVAFLDIEGLPAYIWIDTNNGDFFVSIDEFDEDIIHNFHRDSYSYRFYEYDEILNKYALTQGELFIEGKRAFSIDVEFGCVKIPIVSVLKFIGANIAWNSESVEITYNNCSVRIQTQEQTIQINNEVIYNIETPGGVSYFSVNNGEIYIDYMTARELLFEFGLTTVLSNNKNIYIEQEENQ